MFRALPRVIPSLLLCAGVLCLAPAHAAPDGARVDAGARRFAQSCAFCHGSAGAGGSAPALRGRADLTPADIETTIRNGRQRGGSVMPAWKGALSDAQIGELAAYLLSIQAGGNAAPGTDAGSGAMRP